MPASANTSRRRAHTQKTAHRATPTLTALPATPTTIATPLPHRETPVALRAYLLYEALGPRRSLSALVTALRDDDPAHYRGTDATLLRLLKEWSVRHQWQQRVRAYDTAQEMVRRAEAEERRRAMNDRQATTAEAMASALTRRIGDLLALDQSAINAARDIQNLLALGKPVPPELQDRVTLRPALTIASRELAALWSAALQAERLARGAATEIASAQGDEDATAARADTQAGVVDADNVVFYYPTPALAPRDDDAADDDAVDDDAVDDDAVDDDAVDTAERDA